jgi:hypothetical protein
MIPFWFQLSLIECFLKFILLMHIHMQGHDKCRSYASSPKEKGMPNIDGIRVVGGKMHSSPWLVLHEVTYEICD